MRQIKSEARRQLFLQVMDGDARLGAILFAWNDFARCDEILKWLIVNRITGKNLHAWLQQTFANSILKPVEFIVAKIDREPNYKPFIVGRDFLPGGRA